MENTTDIRRELKGSLDLYVLKRDMLLVCLIDALCLACFAFASGGFRNEVFALSAVMIASITLIPVALYSLWVTAKIFRHPEAYILCRCKLCQPHQCKWSRGAMYFTVVFEDPQDGGKFILDTRPIFASYGMAGPLLEEYINKTVTVAYNQETDAVVVIG